MVNSLDHEDVARGQRMLERAMTAFDLTLEALEEAIDRLRTQEGAGGGAVSKDLKDMNSALVLALNMEEKARAAKAKQQGEVSAGALDLDAARIEIGIRLDCLRAARGGRELSDGAE